jgi:hypothetical protein
VQFSEDISVLLPLQSGSNCAQAQFNADEAAYLNNDSGSRVAIVDAGLQHAVALLVQLPQR